jgi:hypothetical protein
VLTWSAYDQFKFTAYGKIAETETATYDPATGTVSALTVTNTNHDMFCPGISMVASGDIVVTGGNNAEKTSIYSPAQSAWLPGPNMNTPRGYQSSTLLSTGEVCLGRTVTLLVLLLLLLQYVYARHPASCVRDVSASFRQFPPDFGV